MCIKTSGLLALVREEIAVRPDVFPEWCATLALQPDDLRAALSLSDGSPLKDAHESEFDRLAA